MEQKSTELQSNDTKQRIFLSQDNEALRDIFNDLHHYQTPFNGVLQAYKNLENGEFTPEIFSQIVSGNTTAIVDDYRNSLDSHLDSTYVKHNMLRRIVLWRIR